MAPKPDPKIEEDKKHKLKSQSNGNADGTDNWYVPSDDDKNYIRREGNVFTPLICGEQAFADIQNEIKHATKSVDIICWGFDPAMPLVRQGAPDKEWPFWSSAQPAKAINKEELVKFALKELQAKQIEVKSQQNGLKIAEDKAEESNKNGEPPKEQDAGKIDLPQKAKDAFIAYARKTKTYEQFLKDVAAAKADLKKLGDNIKKMITDAQNYLNEIASSVSFPNIPILSSLFNLDGLDDAYNMVQSDKALGEETLGQLLINVATGTKNSVEFSALSAAMEAAEEQATEKGYTGFSKEFFLNAYFKYSGMAEQKKTDDIKKLTKSLIPANTTPIVPDQAGKPKNPQQQETQEGVKVRVLMWYGGWLSTLVGGNAPDFLKSKVSSVLKDALSSAIGKVVETKVNTYLDSKKTELINSVFESSSWKKVTDKIDGILDEVDNTKWGIFGSNNKAKGTEEVTEFVTSVKSLLDNKAASLKDIVRKAGSKAVSSLVTGLTQTAYPARSYYSQAWFTAAATGKIPNVEFRIRQFDPFLPQQLLGILFDDKNDPERTILERATMRAARSHHQKSIVVDYETPKTARGYVMGHNLKSQYWDTTDHFNDVTQGRREPGASTEEPWQDLSCKIIGSCLYDVNQNFTTAWDKSKTSDSALWQKELLSWLPMLQNPKKYLAGKLIETVANVLDHIKTRSDESKPGEVPDSLPHPTEAEQNKKQEPGALTTARAEIKPDQLGVDLLKKNSRAKKTGQITRTYPEGADDSGQKADSIQKSYYEKMIQRPRAFIYTENQYTQLKDWAKKVTDNRQKYAIKIAEDGNGNPLPLYIFMVTPIQEKSGMIQRHHEMLKVWGIQKQLTQVKDINNQQSEATPGDEQYDGGADLPNASSRNSNSNDGLPTAADGSASGKPEFEGASTVAAQAFMLKAVERQDKRTDINGLFGLLGKMGNVGEAIDTFWETQIKGNANKTTFSEEEIQACQNGFESGDDLDFWQKTIHPSRYYTSIYIHSKLAVVDDAVFTLGSANLNQRSMAGDSELNILSDDNDTAFDFRKTVMENHTKPRNPSVCSTTDSLKNNLKKADSNGSLDDDPKCKDNSKNSQTASVIFPKFGNVKKESLLKVRGTYENWLWITKSNELIMMEGKRYIKKIEEEKEYDTIHKGILYSHLCRLIDQRKPGITIA